VAVLWSQRLTRIVSNVILSLYFYVKILVGIQFMQVADIIQDSIVDGTGLRMTIFCQGCVRRCEGCHNPTALEFDGGYTFSVQQLADMALANPLLDGLTFSGGEPFCQAKEFVALAKIVKQKGLNIWCYTGYTLEELLDIAHKDRDVKELLDNIDVLVDGPFVLAQRDLSLKYRGSSNQRLINLPLSLRENRVVLL